MRFAPISSFVLERTLRKNRRPLALKRGAVGVPFVALIALVLGIPRVLCAQQSALSFDDLAARAAAARNQHNFSIAVELYTRAEQLKPDWAEGWFYLGLLQYEENQFREAIDAFSHLLQLQPTAFPAMALRGLCEFETASYTDSLRDLEQAVTSGAANDPHNAQIIHFHLAQLLAHDGRFEDALDQYKFFAMQRISAPDLLLGLGLAGMRITTLPKDVPATDRAIPNAAGEAGYALLAGENEHGDELFQQLFKHYPQTPDLHYFYGLLLFPHDPELAAGPFRDEVAMVPGNELAHAMLAFTLMIAGRYAEALPEAEQALEAMPNLEIAQVALGRSLAETGDPKRAENMLTSVIQRDPGNLEAHLGLVSIYSRSGRREDAYHERMLILGLPR